MKKAWKARTQQKDEKHIRDHLQACNSKSEGVNGQLSDPIPTNGERQGSPSSPLLMSLFISNIPKLLKDGGFTGATLGTSDELRLTQDHTSLVIHVHVHA